MAYRALHVSDCLPGMHKSWGGAEQACLWLMQAERDSGVEVSVITTRPDTPTDLNGIRHLHVKTLESILGRKAVETLSLRHLGLDPVSFIGIRRAIRRLKPDIVHLHRTVRLTLSAALAARAEGIPVVASVYDYFNFCPRETLLRNDKEQCAGGVRRDCAECMGLASPGRIIKGAFVRMRASIFSKLLESATFHALSRASAALVASQGVPANRIHVIALAMPMENCRQEWTVAMERGMILYVGWIQERKGLHVIIKAMPDVLSRIPTARLWVAGDTGDEAYMQRVNQMVAELGIRDKVFILGRKNRQEVEALLRRANVVVVPEQWENMSPLILVEAMCMGKAVLASNVGGIPEFIENGQSGMLAAMCDSGAFAEKIATLLSDEALVERMGRNAAATINNKLDKANIMRDYLSMYLAAKEMTHE